MVIPLQERKGHGFPVSLAGALGKKKPLTKVTRGCG